MLLDRKDVVKWCFVGITETTLADTQNSEVLKPFQKEERDWANAILGGSGSQWTTKLCQDLVAEALTRFGRHNVRKPAQQSSTVRDKRYDPDLECDEYVYEVKGRNWTTTGTAGEKILGVPLKYGEVPRVYDKPLQIILVGYQEYEAREGFAFGDLLDSSDQTEELRNSLAFHKEHDIEYVGFTDILQNLGLGEEFWGN